MPATVGPTSPIPGSSQRRDTARRKSLAAAAAVQLSSALSGAAVAVNDAPCRVVVPCGPALCRYNARRGRRDRVTAVRLEYTNGTVLGRTHATSGCAAVAVARS